jgi:hypothetical protein
VHMPRFICGEVSPTSPENVMENAPYRGIALDMAWISHHRLCLVETAGRSRGTAGLIHACEMNFLFV